MCCVGVGKSVAFRCSAWAVLKVHQDAFAVLLVCFQGLSALLSDEQRVPREGAWGRPYGVGDAEGARGPTEEGGPLQDVPLELPVWLGWRDDSDAAELFFASIHG